MLEGPFNSSQDDSDILEKPKPTMINHKISFMGEGSEYFRIWIVNTALTIITLGFYWPWARVRTRRYFYSHTKLAGTYFEYLAKPGPILRGYLIVMTGYLAYMFSQYLNPALSLMIMGLFFVIWPWLYLKAIRFKFHNSSYRNIRFCFDGKLKDSYKINLGMTLLIPFTLGILFPHIESLKKRFLFNNLSFGKTRLKINIKSAPFYRYYLAAAGIALLGYLALIIGMIIAFAITSLINDGLPDPSKEYPLKSLYITYLIMILLMPIYFTAFIWLQQLLKAKITNYCLNNLTSENGISFESYLDVWDMTKIAWSNLFLIIFTFGIYAPWASIKMHKYVISKIYLVEKSNALDKITGNDATENVAIGDAASDVFDFDIGF